MARRTSHSATTWPPTKDLSLLSWTRRASIGCDGAPTEAALHRASLQPLCWRLPCGQRPPCRPEDALTCVLRAAGRTLYVRRTMQPTKHGSQWQKCLRRCERAFFDPVARAALDGPQRPNPATAIFLCHRAEIDRFSEKNKNKNKCVIHLRTDILAATIMPGLHRL